MKHRVVAAILAAVLVVGIDVSAAPARGRGVESPTPGIREQISHVVKQLKKLLPPLGVQNDLPMPPKP